MTTTKKSRKGSKKTDAKKPEDKKAAPSQKLPEAEQGQEKATLPRGQERLPDGTIRLKTGTHNKLAKKKYDVHGVTVELSGDVLIANKDVDWLSIGKCSKCGTERPDGVKVRRAGQGQVVLIYTCSNKKGCDLGGLTYVQVHSAGRFLIGK